MHGSVTPARPASPVELRKFSLFERLSESELRDIFGALRPQAATHISSPAHPDDVLLIWSGSFQLFVRAGSGEPILLRTLGAGDHVGDIAALLGPSGPTYALESIEPGIVLALSGQNFRKLAARMPALHQAALEGLANNAINNANRIFELTALSERERLAVQLMQMAKGRSHAQWPPGRCHVILAAQIGASEDAVVDLLSAFESEGLIACAEQQISILQPERLEREYNRAVEALAARWGADRG